jgi:hypothetical protein
MEQLERIMEERAAEKQQALAKLRAAIGLIERQHRELDNWERVHFVHGLAAMFAGAYRLAGVEAGLALTPLVERSPAALLPSDAIFDRSSTEFVKRALVYAEAEPVRRFPSFGPVEFR